MAQVCIQLFLGLKLYTDDSSVFLLVDISLYKGSVEKKNNSNILDNQGCNVPEFQTISFECLS